MELLKVIGATVVFAALVFKWWVDKNSAKQKRLDEIDKEIDGISSSDDTLRQLDKLRNK